MKISSNSAYFFLVLLSPNHTSLQVSLLALVSTYSTLPALSFLPLLCTCSCLLPLMVDSRYLNSSAFTTSASCIYNKLCDGQATCPKYLTSCLITAGIAFIPAVIKPFQMISFKKMDGWVRKEITVHGVWFPLEGYQWGSHRSLKTNKNPQLLPKRNFRTSYCRTLIYYTWFRNVHFLSREFHLFDFCNGIH